MIEYLGAGAGIEFSPRTPYSRLQKVGISAWDDLAALNMADSGWCSFFSRLWGCGTVIFQLSGFCCKTPLGIQWTLKGKNMDLGPSTVCWSSVVLWFEFLEWTCSNFPASEVEQWLVAASGLQTNRLEPYTQNHIWIRSLPKRSLPRLIGTIRAYEGPSRDFWGLV